MANPEQKMEESIVVNRSPEEVYSFWRKLENLPRFMEHLESVRETGANRSHWVLKTPGGPTLEWDAEIVNEVPDQLLEWRSLPESEVMNRGTVRFRPAQQGTEIHVSIQYSPPGGAVGSTAAKMANPAISREVRKELENFKRIIESGEASGEQRRKAG